VHANVLLFQRVADGPRPAIAATDCSAPIVDLDSVRRARVLTEALRRRLEIKMRSCRSGQDGAAA
jgi:hypothetical protein